MIIGLSGYAQSGKDSTAELLCLNYGYRVLLSLTLCDKR